MDFSKFNKAINKDEFKKELEDIKKNGGGEYAEIPHGNYNVKIEKMEMRETKAEPIRPMFSVQFRILDGEFKNSCIFMNQVITEPFQIHIVNQFMESLDTDVSDISFDGDYEHYNDLIMDVFENCDRLEFDLNYGENRKGYNTFRIDDVFDATFN